MDSGGSNDRAKRAEDIRADEFGHLHSLRVPVAADGCSWVRFSHVRPRKMGANAIMSDRYCPNCQQNVSPRGHGCAAQVVWTIVGLPVMLVLGVLCGVALHLGGGSAVTVTENGQTSRVSTALIYGIYVGLGFWAIGILVELTAYRQKCPICRTTGLGSSR